MALASCWSSGTWLGCPSRTACKLPSWSCTHRHSAPLRLRLSLHSMVMQCLHPSALVGLWLVWVNVTNIDWLFFCPAGIGYFIFRKSNSQKNQFRRDPSHPSVASQSPVLLNLPFHLIPRFLLSLVTDFHVFVLGLLSLCALCNVTKCWFRF